MKVAYLSVYRDGTGYANAALENILALEAAGIDVVCRPISLTPPKPIKDRCLVEHLEQKSLDGINVVIQHSLPHTFEYRHGVRNIGFVDWETTNFKRSNWSQCCDLMDELWVPCVQNRQALINSDVRKPIRVIPHSRDVAKFVSPPQPLRISALDGKCVFYTVAEFSKRKNFAGLLRAYYQAFSNRDDVVLVIKTHAPGKDSEAMTNMMKTMTSEIKQSMHMFFKHDNYPPVVALTDLLSEEQLSQLHVRGDVFVLLSHGDAWAIPAHDAMGFGNPVVVSNWGGLPDLTYAQAAEYWEAEKNLFKHPGDIPCGWLVDGQLTSCFGMVNSFPDLYTGDEMWFEPNLVQGAECLRQAYNEWREGTLDRRGRAAIERTQSLSHVSVGQVMKTAISG